MADPFSLARLSREERLAILRERLAEVAERHQDDQRLIREFLSERATEKEQEGNGNDR